MAEIGAASAPQLQRRMLAIMASDVVGYSRQMEADEAATIARVTALRAEIQREGEPASPAGMRGVVTPGPW